MKDSYGSVVVRLFFKDKELSLSVESFKYVYDEEGEDLCTITIATDNRDAPDLPEFQDNAELKVIWGYIDQQYSNTRKIYIQDSAWDYSNQNIRGVLDCSPKATVLKKLTSKHVHKNTNLLDVAHTMGEANGIKVSVELPTSGKSSNNTPKSKPKYITSVSELLKVTQTDNTLPKVKMLVTKDLVTAMKKQYEQQKAKDSADLKNFGSTEAQLRADAQVVPINVPAELARREQWTKMVASFHNYDSVPQANKSNKALLDQLARKEKNGPYVVESRDDEIIIKKRKFDKAPYKTYEYGGDNSDLLAFVPQTKQRSYSGSGTSMNYSGWNPGNKTFMTGQTDAANTNEPESLAKYRQRLANLQDKSNDFILGTSGVRREFGARRGAMSGAGDNTNVVKNVFMPITVFDTKQILTNTIKKFENAGKEFNDPTADANKLFNHASNTRNSAELNKNPGTFKMVGDPGLESGMIITITNVSKKFSGNHYITKCTHTIDENGGYEIEGELKRQGHNTKSNNSYVDARSIGSSVNTQLGPDDSEKEKTKRVPVKKNKK